MYESKGQRPATRAQFLRRLVRAMAWASGLLCVSLAAGMAGYHALEGMPWVDAFLNAAMLLGGMGPVDAPRTQAGKIFAGIYALYAGLVFIVTAAMLVTPLAHRMLHRFHWTEKL